MDFILFISIIISTIKCIKNFELGLRDIILKNRIKLSDTYTARDDFKINFNKSEL